MAKPPEFSGEDCAWLVWKFKFTLAMALLNIRRAIKYCSEMEFPVNLYQLSPEVWQDNTQLSPEGWQIIVIMRTCREDTETKYT
eukprot:8293001-Heterocapsa_arctica.AAC.2